MTKNYHLAFAIILSIICVILSAYTLLDNSLLAGGLTLLWLITFEISDRLIEKHKDKKVSHDS